MTGGRGVGGEANDDIFLEEVAEMFSVDYMKEDVLKMIEEMMT